MEFKKKLTYLYVWLDYGVILPFLTLLPQKLGRYGARLRGIVYYHKQRDWRSFTFGDHDLWARVHRSYRAMFPDLEESRVETLAQERYIHQSIEEYETTALIMGNFPTNRVEYEGLEEVLSIVEQNPHHVFITAHFGSSLVGVHFLHALGIPVLGMSSNVTKHPIVHPVITKLYRQKYDAIGRFLNGGEVIDREGNTRTFFKFLKNRGSLVIIADLPPSSVNEEAHYVPFFNQYRGLASGAKKLSETTQCKIIGFVSYFENGKHVLKFDTDNDAYRFLENEIIKRPGMWWASDMLEMYPVKTEEE